jgi:hypothetical protein
MEVASGGKAQHAFSGSDTPRSVQGTNDDRQRGCRSCEWTLAQRSHALGISIGSHDTQSPLSHPACAKAGYFRDDFIAFTS